MRPVGHVAILANGQETTVGGLLARADAIARVLDSAAAAGGRVLVPTDDPVFALAAAMACARAGAAAVPWRRGVHAITEIAGVVGARLAVLPDSSEIAHCETLSTNHSQTQWPGDLIVMTSGSTGAPKGVVLDGSAVAINAALALAQIDVRRCAGWAVDLDIGLMSALSHFMMAWQADRPLRFLGGMGRPGRAACFAEGFGFGGAPLQLLQLAEHLPADVQPPVLVSSGDFLDAGMIARLRERFPATALVKLYGLTELSGRFCIAPDALLWEKPDSAGRPLPGYVVALAQEEGGEDGGEIMVESPLLFHGYCRPGEGFLPRESGPFATGDLGCIDGNGVLRLLGRRGDMFKVAGEKVDRLTIERALRPMFAAAEICVLPVRHPLLGSMPVLFIGASDGAVLPSWSHVVAHLRSLLPSRYIPAQMVVVDGGLPKLGNAKVDRQHLLAGLAGYGRLP